MRKLRSEKQKKSIAGYGNRIRKNQNGHCIDGCAFKGGMGEKYPVSCRPEFPGDTGQKKFRQYAAEFILHESGGGKG